MSTLHADTILDIVARTVRETQLPMNADGRPLQFVENDYLAADGMPNERGFDIVLREFGDTTVSSHEAPLGDTERKMAFDVNLFYVAAGMNMRTLSATVARDCASVLDRVPRAIHLLGEGAHCEISGNGVFQPISNGNADNAWLMSIPFEAAWFEPVEA